MTRYILDDDGDRWPITGHWCSHCAMPLTKVHEHQTTHPWCAFRDELDRATACEVINELTRQLEARPIDPDETDQ